VAKRILAKPDTHNTLRKTIEKLVTFMKNQKFRIHSRLSRKVSPMS
jgi:hypothetical protein